MTPNRVGNRKDLGSTKITVVIPVFNERETLTPLVESILAHAGSHPLRILFIDDGSDDGSYEVLCDLYARFAEVDFVRLRRNFGKSAALAAGFARVEGDLVITMDGDFQDDPKEIPRFIEKIQEGYDVVVGWKAVRRDPWHKTIPSRIYNRCVSWLFGLGLHDVNCGYKALRAEVARDLRVYGEMHRLIPVLAANLGYRVTEIAVEHNPRTYGKSKYGFERFSRGAVDVVSALFLSRYRETPGHFFGPLAVAGIVLGVGGMLAGALVWALGQAPVVGLAFCLSGVALLVGGVVIGAVGLAAELVVQKRALVDPAPYIVEEHRH